MYKGKNNRSDASAPQKKSSGRFRLTDGRKPGKGTGRGKYYTPRGVTKDAGNEKADNGETRLSFILRTARDTPR